MGPICHRPSKIMIALTTMILPGIYEPFDVVTSHALEHTLAEHSIPFDERLLVQLMAAYNRLKESAA